MFSTVPAGYGDAVVTALGVDAPPDLVERWHVWFAPELQPFRSEKLGDHPAGELPAGRPCEPSAEVRDTFHLYGAPQVWLEEAEFTQLPLRARRALLSGREATGRLTQHSEAVRAIAAAAATDSRIVWWPSLVQRAGNEPVLTYVEDGVRPSRHREVNSSTWSAAERLLPGAAALAGTFPSASGPNCFGTVMAAAGVPGAESQWMVQEPFESWLAECAAPVRGGTSRDHLPGVLLVWRDAEGLAAHAAVTIGNGYCFSKPSQAWCSPRLVWTVGETIAVNRYKGQTLNRYMLVTA